MPQSGGSSIGVCICCAYVQQLTIHPTLHAWPQNALSVDDMMSVLNETCSVVTGEPMGEEKTFMLSLSGLKPVTQPPSHTRYVMEYLTIV